MNYINKSEYININNDYTKKNSEEDIFRSYPQIFTKEFNILEFKQNIGKDHNFAIICANIFEKNKMFVKIYKETFTRFIEEIGSAYLNKNLYHNVRFILKKIVSACCRCNSILLYVSSRRKDGRGIFIYKNINY